MYNVMLIKDNLFSANHRSNMMLKYGYTGAMTVTVEDLLDEMKGTPIEDHDCHLSPEDGCSCNIY